MQQTNQEKNNKLSKGILGEKSGVANKYQLKLTTSIAMLRVNTKSRERNKFST